MISSIGNTQHNFTNTHRNLDLIRLVHTLCVYRSVCVFICVT